MGRRKDFPPKIKYLLEKKGVFNISREERQKIHFQCMKELEEIPHFDYEAKKGD